MILKLKVCSVEILFGLLIPISIRVCRSYKVPLSSIRTVRLRAVFVRVVMRLTLSPNPTAAYHTNHTERGGAGKPEVDFSTRTPLCVMGLLSYTLGTEWN